MKHSLENSGKGGGMAVLLVPFSLLFQPLCPRAGRGKSTRKSGAG